MLGGEHALVERVDRRNVRTEFGNGGLGFHVTVHLQGEGVVDPVAVHIHALADFEGRFTHTGFLVEEELIVVRGDDRGGLVTEQPRNPGGVFAGQHDVVHRGSVGVEHDIADEEIEHDSPFQGLVCRG